MVVRRLTKEQMSEFNYTIIYCRNIPTELQVGASSTVTAVAPIADRRQLPFAGTAKFIFV